MSERVAELRAAIAERDTERVPKVTITCSSCGRTDAIAGPDLDHIETEFADWQIDDERPYFDYCPDCSESPRDTPASHQERGRSRRPKKLIAYRVTYDNGHEKTFELQALNISTGYHKALYLARKGHARTPEWQIARVEFVEVIER
jgi:hypothetical protein